MPTVDQLIVWVIVGLLGGSVAGMLMTWGKEGYGMIRNLGLGLAGALVGGFLFRLLGILPNLDKIAISFRDVVAAFARIADRAARTLDLAAIQSANMKRPAQGGPLASVVASFDPDQLTGPPVPSVSTDGSADV